MTDALETGEVVTDEVPAAEQTGTGCPISDEFLPPNMRKHVDPAAPAALRMMAAKGLVPLAPSDLVCVLFMLMYDADAQVREMAGKTATTLADRIAGAAFRDESLFPPVLSWYAQLYAQNDAYAQLLILNPNTPDEAVAALAATCSAKASELIAQNQLRLLRCDDIIRELAKNPHAQGALIDGVCDFAVRSGLNLPDVVQIQAARVRVFGAQVETEPVVDSRPTAEQLIQEFGMSQEVDVSAPAALEEGRKQTLAQKINEASIAEKIKLATKGNKEARNVLIRDSNKLVAVAVIRSPRITDGEVMAQAQNKVAHDEVLRIIYSNREWLRKYAIKLALVKNPKVPQGISMRLLNQLHEGDVKSLARDKNVPNSVQMLAKKQLDKKNEARRT